MHTTYSLTDTLKSKARRRTWKLSKALAEGGEAPAEEEVPPF